jgi:acyl-coenzyme A thioesterase PaaI-like protein
LSRIRNHRATLAAVTSIELEDGESIQDRYFSDGRCFGCGPANEHGLHLRSFPVAEGLVAEWEPAPQHEAFPGVLCGGIIGTLLDCHGNWTAWSALFERDGVARPYTVTARYEVKLLRPTPLDRPVSLRSEPIEVMDDRVEVEALLESDGEPTAKFKGLFVRPTGPLVEPR